MKKVIKKKRISRDLILQKKKFLEYYLELPVQKLAAASIGKDETTIIRWKAKDTNFANQIESAKATWAKKNVQQVKSKEWLLERLMNDHFGEKKEVKLSGDLQINRISNLKQ